MSIAPTKHIENIFMYSYACPISWSRGSSSLWLYSQPIIGGEFVCVNIIGVQSDSSTEETSKHNPMIFVDSRSMIVYFWGISMVYLTLYPGVGIDIKVPHRVSRNGLMNLSSKNVDSILIGTHLMTSSWPWTVLISKALPLISLAFHIHSVKVIHDAK